MTTPLEKHMASHQEDTRRMPQDEPAVDPEPRWPAIIALLAVGSLYLALPKSMTLGPRWLLIAIVTALMVPAIVTHQKGMQRINQIVGFLVAGVVTLFEAISLVLLVHGLPSHKESGFVLLRSAAAIWITNVLVFASWYWRLDAGGPNERDRVAGHIPGAFLFPQMTMTPDAREQAGLKDWSPVFIDYLFLAFNTSAAFSPTDTMVLSPWAKVLMMIQSIISIAIIAFLAGRVVNIL